MARKDQEGEGCGKAKRLTTETQKQMMGEAHHVDDGTAAEGVYGPERPNLTYIAFRRLCPPL